MTYTLWGYCGYLVSAPWLRVKTTLSHTAKLPSVSSALCGTEHTAATEGSLAAAPVMPSEPAVAGQPPGGGCVLEGWVLPSEAGCPQREGLLQGPALGGTVPGWGPGRAARCERSPAPPLGATPSRSRCGAASSPAGCAPPGRPRPPPAAAATAAAARRDPWLQPRAASGGGASKEGREGRQGKAGRRRCRGRCSAAARGACGQRGRRCPGAEREGQRPGRAPTPAQSGRCPGTAAKGRVGFLFFLQEAGRNSDNRSSNTVPTYSDAANALGALENGREAGKGWWRAVATLQWVLSVLAPSSREAFI